VRFKIPRYFLLVILLSRWLLAGSFCAPLYAEAKPNIIFILADDLGYGDLGCYGGRFVPTPNVDRMAAAGMQFTQHYAGSTVCAPSRACLLTGQHTGHVYQRANGELEFRPDPRDICVARLLKNAGYATGLIGKSGLSCNSENGRLPNEKGFDHFFGFTSHAAAHRYYPKRLWRNGREVVYPKNHGREGDQYSGDLFIEDALRFIDTHAKEPFFLHLALQQPHADLNVPDAWVKPFLNKFEEAPFAGGHYRAETHPKATYAGMIAHLDSSVGRVIAKLRDLGIDENTIVFFSSDNGAMSEGGWNRSYFDSSGPLRGGKRDLYEGGIRVPLICWWPGKIAPGTTSDHITAFWDFAPTACELASAEAPSPTDGISYLPTLLGSGDQSEHSHLYWEFYEQGGKQAVRKREWKAVRLNVLGKSEREVELYNLRNDLAEERNLAEEHPEITAELVRLMSESHVGNGDFQIKP
jgi:arylsulfatase A